MRGIRTGTAAIAMAFALLPGMGSAQAITVSPSGAITQESATTSTIAPDDQSTKEQLTKLFEVMRIREQVQSVQKMVPLMVERQIQEQSKVMNERLATGSKLTEKQRAQLQTISNKYVEKAINIYPVEEMIGDMTTLYQRYLSREDVDAMIAFYQSPAGQHLLDAQPKIAQEYMPLVMQRVSERAKVLTEEMMKETEALRKSSQPAPAQPARK